MPRVITQQYRESKYCNAIRSAVSSLGHATNMQILELLREGFPGVSATTVHRATARLARRGDIGSAPPDVHRAMRYDAVITPHDHFMCERCGLLRDADLGGALRPLIEQAVGGDCSISGRLTVSGICKACHNEGI